MERKLAAIFSADVKGYSRLMGDDEIATVRTLTAYREVMTTLIHAHRGRVVDSPGDNLLAEFASVVDAVQCATEIQQVTCGAQCRVAATPPYGLSDWHQCRRCLDRRWSSLRGWRQYCRPLGGVRRGRGDLVSRKPRILRSRTNWH